MGLAIGNVRHVRWFSWTLVIMGRHGVSQNAGILVGSASNLLPMRWQAIALNQCWMFGRKWVITKLYGRTVKCYKILVIWYGNYMSVTEILARILKFVTIFLLFSQKNTEICVNLAKITEIIVICYSSKFPWVDSAGFVLNTCGAETETFQENMSIPWLLVPWFLVL